MKAISPAETRRTKVDAGFNKRCRKKVSMHQRTVGGGGGGVGWGWGGGGTGGARIT